jgi:signal transduction histidine kinase
MNPDLLLFAELLLFLTGTLLYGFLARELIGRRAVLPGWPLRLLVVCLTLWFLGNFLDQLLAMMLSPGLARSRVALRGGWLATGFDLLRAYAFLLSFPLLTHGVWRLLRDDAPPLRAGELRPPGRDLRPGWGWLLPGYLSLLMFVPAALQALEERQILLTETARRVFLLFILHVVISSLGTAWMLVRALRVVENERLAQFLRWLLGGLALMVGLLALGAGFLALGEERQLPASLALWRLAVESSGLVPGLTFLYFVQRYNLMRLSISYRSLRRFVNIFALVLLVILAGPAVGVAGTQSYHRFVAWGLLVALLAGVIATPLQQAATRRFVWLRRLLGQNITAEEIEQVTRRIQSLDLSEEEMRDLVSREIGEWLATRARFLLSPDRGPGLPLSRELTLLWRHFSDPGTRTFNRLDAPTMGLSSLLQRAGLQAAFPLRVGGELVAVLILETSPTGGGYEEGEVEAVQLVMRQLAAVLEIRRLAEERLSVERQMAERERLSLLGMVAASLAHEVKNPLSSMKALAQTVREELVAADAESEQAQDLGLIVEQIDRLHGVAREILDFARVPATGEGVLLTSLLRSTLYVLGHQARQRGIVLDAEAVAEVGHAGGTSATWQTVFFNLILNALQHAPAGSTVRVGLERLTRDGNRREEMVFWTENGGPAIVPAIAQRMFEPFVSDGGHGLGLALVAQRVRELGGHIEVENVPERIVFRVWAGGAA